MSRFEETLQRDLRQIADRATPSPDAWSQIQSRIADQDPIQETEIIMLTENTTTRRLRPLTETNRRWPLVAAAAAVVALAITGIALVNRGDTEELPAEPATPTVAPAPEPESETEPETGADEPASALEVPAVGEAIPPGTYRTDQFGLPLAFEVPDTASSWIVQVDDDVALTLGPEGAFVNLSRVGSFYDADESAAPWPGTPEADGLPGLGSLGALDIDAWIAANGLVVDEQGETTIGGRTAAYRRVVTPIDAAGGCPAELQPCLMATSASADLQDVWAGPSTVVYGELPFAFWVVELDDFEPIMVWVGFPTPTEWPDPQSWFDEVQPLLDSIVFGDPAPATGGGTARVSTSGQDSATTAELPEAGELVNPGTYRSDALGFPVTFHMRNGRAGAFAVTSEEPGAIEFQVEGASPVEYFGMLRVGSFYDITEALDPETNGTGSIPADGIDDWIAANGITVESSTELQLDGRTTQLRRVVIDVYPEGRGFGFSRSADLDSTPNELFAGEWINAIWLVEMGEFEPVMIFAATDGTDQTQWLDEVALPIVDSIVFGDPAPVVEGGTARVPLRVTGSSAYSGVRTDGERLADGSTPITYAATTEGSMAGEIVGTGIWAIDSEGVTTGSDEYTFTGTIAGVGTGTLSWTTEWTATGPAQVVATDSITGGTGDFAEAGGTLAVAVESSERVGIEDTVTGTVSFELAIPRSG